MEQYNKDRIARLFDNLADQDRGTDDDVSRASIPHLVGQAALDALDLEREDVLLDVGTGTGRWALEAARLCRQVIGIDISSRSLDQARAMAKRANLDNLVFARGSFEEPCSHLDLASSAITKILAVYSIHHLPDHLKKESLATLAGLLMRPGRMVIGDMMFFDDPDRHRESFDDVHYDGGDTDFPACPSWLGRCLEQLGARVRVTQIHALAGLVVADFSRHSGR